MGRLEKHLSSKNNPIRKRSGSPRISKTTFFGELIKNLYTHARFIPHFIFLSTRYICVPVSG